MPDSLIPLLPYSLEDLLKQKAVSLGFDLVGITTAEPSAFAFEYRDWIANGYAGEMEYLARNIERRLDPSQLLPDARSIIVVGMNYYVREEEAGTDNEEEADRKPDRAIFARYARGDDYHDVMTPRLRTLLDWLKKEAGGDADGKVYVDTGPVLEREVARRAGLGWFGKNTMLINTRRGSYFFIGEIVTNVALTPDEPAVGGCGTCTKCLDACPTDAFTAPFVLDARRCISYLTIELKGAIPEEFVPAIAETRRVYGCDICQECCPFNRDRELEGPRTKDQEPSDMNWKVDLSGAEPPHSEPKAAITSSPLRGRGKVRGQADGNGGKSAELPAIHGSVPTNEPAFQPRQFIKDPKDVNDLLYLTQEEFSTAFKGSAVKRAKRRGLIRNAAVALAGRTDPEALAALEQALNDPEELVREAAAWALTSSKSVQ